ncbi:MAG: hypothetical protein ACTIKC_06740 [Psychrobacter sp.]
MKSFTVKNTWSTDGNHGWGNGYVAIPPTSSWHGANYNQIPVSVHGGLTWSSFASAIRKRDVEVPSWVDDNDWVVGFDTVRESSKCMHKSDVERETHKLLGAIEHINDIPCQKYLITQTQCPNCHILNDVSHLVDDYGIKEPRLHCCEDCGKHFYFSI